MQFMEKRTGSELQPCGAPESWIQIRRLGHLDRTLGLNFGVEFGDVQGLVIFQRTSGTDKP
jgi:hypothetical protein